MQDTCISTLSSVFCIHQDCLRGKTDDCIFLLSKSFTIPLYLFFLSVSKVLSTKQLMSHEPTAVDVKPDGSLRDHSLGRRGSAVELVPVKRPSVLQRMGIAPLDLGVGAAKTEYDAADLPPRSPTERVVRSHSGLVNRQISKLKLQKVREEAEQAALAGGQWHKVPEEAMYEQFKSRPCGLTSQEALSLAAVHGKNQITAPPAESLLMKFIKNCFGGFSLLLLGAALLAFLIVIIVKSQQQFLDIQTLALGISLILVILITSAFATLQEGAAADVMVSLQKMAAESVYCMRDGLLQKIPAVDLVPGDVLKICGGEKVPADLRVFSGQDLKVNNAPLTGESVDIKLGSEPKHEDLFEARNIARSGCTVTSGSGLAIVFATGDHTYLGKIAKATTSAEPPDTMLKREVRRIIFFMVVISIVLSAIILALSLSRGDKWFVAVVYLVGVLIANVPEGLLPQITVALTLTAKRMMKKGVLVSNLEIIETLGAVTVICSDKTGTITCNRMTASHFYAGGTLYRNPQTGVYLDLPVFDSAVPVLQRLMQAAVLNTEAAFTSFEDDIVSRSTRGDASETALIKFFEGVEPVEAYRSRNPRVGVIPFNSTNKYMCSVNSTNEADTTHCIFMKGAAERVLDRCAGVHQSDGQIVPMDAEKRAELDRIVLNLAGKGERVLTFAEVPFSVPDGMQVIDDDGEPNFPMQGLNFVGFISLIDPPRPSVRGAMDECRNAGVKVIMVTGDHPATAVAICQSLGYDGAPVEALLRTEATDAATSFCVVHGINDIPKFSDEDWDFIFKCKQIVFARTMPEQKQEIVRRLLKLGQIVAMTGDGVNDAAALKVAHVGIAMGSGSAVARDSAQVVLLNDDFGAIVEGIREGRLIFENLKKCVAYVLSHLVPEYLPFLLTTIAGLPLGMQTLVIVCIDLGTELFAGVMLAHEEAEDNIMKIPPRSPDSHLTGPKMLIITYFFVGIIESFASFWGFVYVFNDHGFPLSSLWGQSTRFSALTYGDLTSSDSDAMLALCSRNSFYLAKFPNQCDCGSAGSPVICENFYSFCQRTLQMAQASYFLHLVWAQLANLIVRRCSINSSVTWERMKSNPKLIFPGMAWSVAVAILFVFTPGFNFILQFAYLPVQHCFTGLWVLPIMIGADELRKYFVRRNPSGLLARLTVF
jgi:sodium/potassium-transporting ATPase subunit alpha